MAVDPRDPDTCYVAALGHLWGANDERGVYKTDDGGASWDLVLKIDEKTGACDVLIDPHDPDTAWFIPGVRDQLRYPRDGQLVVTRTADAGKSFDVLTNGLPQQHAYDLIFRHAFDIDGDGERLAFGSTTGNFWISETRGENWQLISSTLPPVYCVRFSAHQTS